MLWELVGTVATLCILVSYVPQIVKSYRTRRMDDFSLMYISIISFGVFLWILYGAHAQDPIIMYSNIFILAMSLSLVGMKLYYSRRKMRLKI